MKWLVIILTAMFTGAKLAGAISWSWWLVFSPVIAYYDIVAGMVVTVMLVALVTQIAIGFKKGWKDNESYKCSN